MSACEGHGQRLQRGANKRRARNEPFRSPLHHNFIHVACFSPWRTTLTGLVTALLLCTGVFTGACEARCDLAQFGVAACHGGESHGTLLMADMVMLTQPGSPRDIARPPQADQGAAMSQSVASSAYLTGPPCAHHGCVQVPARLPSAPTWPIAPMALETTSAPWTVALAGERHIPLRSVPGRAAQSPVSLRTMLRV